MLSKSQEYSPSPIYAVRSLSYIKEIGIVNISGYDIWISDQTKNCYHIKNKSYGASGNKSLMVYTRTDNEAYDRKFDMNGVEQPKDPKGFLIDRYIIDVKALLSQGYIYINDIGTCIAFNREDAIAYNLTTEEYQARHTKNLMEMFKTAITMAPFKVMCNDPFCKLNGLWTIINNTALAIDITHISGEPEVCRVYIGIKPGDYSVADISFDDILKGEYVFKCGNTDVMLFTTKELAIKQIYKNKSNLNVFTYDDFNKKLKEYKQNVEADIAATNNKCEILQQENIVLRQQLNTYMDKAKTLSDTIYKESLNKQALERELYKTEKEKLSFEKEKLSTEAKQTDNLASMMKSLATIVPIVVSVISLLVLKKP